MAFIFFKCLDSKANASPEAEQNRKKEVGIKVRTETFSCNTLNAYTITRADKDHSYFTDFVQISRIQMISEIW